MAIRTIESLREHLQWAIEIEHATIPPYLCALYSIKAGRNQEAHEVIESVFLEEMLHMTLAANLLNAVGGTPQIDKPDFIPQYPAYLPHSNNAFQVPLLKFSPEAIDVFLKIEKPEAHDVLPEDDNYETIGQFYEAIEVGLRDLCARLGETAVFCGDPARQIRGDSTYYGGSGEIIAVEDLASAIAAIEEIIEQGEGMQHQEVWDGDRNMFHPEREEVAHYFRFNEIKQGRTYRPGDTPQSGPSGATFTVDWDAVYNMRPNPQSADYAGNSEITLQLQAFNAAYWTMLRQLHQSVNGQPEQLSVAVGTMYEIKTLAIELMQLPSGDGETTVGPTFAYVPATGAQTTTSSPGQRISVQANGPYLVYGEIPLLRKAQIISEHGEPLSWQKGSYFDTGAKYALCRCGQSARKPFCDGTHARVDFDGTETAETNTTEARRIVFADGTNITVRRDNSLCMEAGFCGNRFKNIPQLIKETDDSIVRAQVMAMIERCPSGSYSYSVVADGDDVEPSFPKEIAVVQEGEYAGPLWVTGEIDVERADGKPFECRNRTTLCRCGQSRNKPLCDGTHREIGFTEG